MSEKPEQSGKDANKTFDIYHVFSRWDFWLLIAFVVAMLVLLLWFRGQGGAV